MHLHFWTRLQIYVYISDHDTFMLCKENQVSRKGVYYSQHAEHRASMLVITKGWQESRVPSLPQAQAAHFWQRTAFIP